jgi:hypothetical protein
VYHNGAACWIYYQQKLHLWVLASKFQQEVSDASVYEQGFWLLSHGAAASPDEVRAQSWVFPDSRLHEYAPQPGVTVACVHVTAEPTPAPTPAVTSVQSQVFTPRPKHIRQRSAHERKVFSRMTLVIRILNVLQFGSTQRIQFRAAVSDALWRRARIVVSPGEIELGSVSKISDSSVLVGYAITLHVWTDFSTVCQPHEAPVTGTCESSERFRKLGGPAFAEELAYQCIKRGLQITPRDVDASPPSVRQCDTSFKLRGKRHGHFSYAFWCKPNTRMSH